ncbi:MAG: hypothetical protein EOP51_19405 [Sphingobacteriales bacterium]|nr:MAG: hypothetical protein EOP51_19405 [Sphingobacteriales bacterium]
MRKNKTTLLFFLVFAILSGPAIHFSNPVTAILVLFFWLAAAFFSLVIVVVGLFSNKFQLWYLIGFLPFLVGYSYGTTIRNYKHDKAVRLNLQIEDYKTKYSKYPQNLSDLNAAFSLSGLTYRANEDLTNYSIEYLMDQFNREYYKSDSKEWGTLGWND